MNEDLTKVYGVYLSRDDNEEHPIHECILPLRHYRKLIEILSKSLESEQNQDLHSKIDSEFGDFIEYYLFRKFGSVKESTCFSPTSSD